MKNLRRRFKNTIYSIVIVCGLLFTFGLTVDAQKADFSFRNAVYYMSPQDSNIKTSNKYAFPGTKMTLYSKDALRCTEKFCEVKFGVFAQRKNSTNGLPVNVSILNQSGAGKASVETVNFADGQGTAELTFIVNVYYGESNTILMKIDPNNKYDEADEMNNAFESSITLEKPLANPTGSTKENIERAFKDVYGYPPDAQRYAFWEAQNPSYDKVVTTEAERQNAESIARKLMISRVYKDTMGRVATASEIDYWLPKKEYYKQILEANRAYLYSPNGAKDLVETVKRALTVNTGKTPSDEEIKSAASKYRQTKAVYDEMN